MFSVGVAWVEHTRRVQLDCSLLNSELHSDRESPLNWEAVGATGEVVAAIGVIATLAYLAVQVRQNSVLLAESAKLTEYGIFEANANSAIEIRKMMLLNPELFDLQDRGNHSFVTLEPSDRRRFDALTRIILQASQTMYHRQLLFRHDPDEHAGPTRFLERWCRMQGFREWLDQADPDWRPEFRELVRSTIEKIDLENSQ